MLSGVGATRFNPVSQKFTISFLPQENVGRRHPEHAAADGLDVAVQRAARLGLNGARAFGAFAESGAALRATRILASDCDRLRVGRPAPPPPVLPPKKRLAYARAQLCRHERAFRECGPCAVPKLATATEAASAKCTCRRVRSVLAGTATGWGRSRTGPNTQEAPPRASPHSPAPLPRSPPPRAR